MNLKQQREAALKAARDVAEKAKSESRGFTNEEQEQVEGFMSKADELAAQIASAAKSDDLMARLTGMGSGDHVDRDDAPAKSISEHFVKSLGGKSLKDMPGKFTTPEFKAASDTQAVGGTGGAFGPLVTDVDKSFVLPYQRPLVVADLMGTGTVSGNAIKYPVFPANIEGGTGMVAEGGAKPQLHVPDPTWVTDSLGEVAGWFKVTDDMSEDIPYVVSQIEQVARYNLLLNEETQLLSGNGTDPNLRGLLNRTGVQTYQTPNGGKPVDAIFHAFGMIQNATGFVADGVVINPTDYEALRLGVDGNGQYFGGGYFAGQYGNGGIAANPPLWGKTTVVTSAVAAGTVVVGAFKASTAVFRKGGLRVESTNSHADDFTNDKITIRLRERLGLQVQYPAAVVKVTLAPAGV